MHFIRLTVLECREPAISIAGPEGPAVWSERDIYFNADSVLRLERKTLWGRAYTQLTTSDNTRFKVDETPEVISATLRQQP